MIVGVGLAAHLGLSVDELRDAGVEAARLGFESCWTPAGSVPDAFHVCARWSEATAAVVPGGLTTGISVVPAARMWSVPALALQAATVGQLSGGRFILGIGTGGYGERFWSSLGLPDKPILVMREYLDALRRVLAGEVVSTQGTAVRIDGFGVGEGLPRVPVQVAALGPQMLRLAGRSSDGALLNWASPAEIARSRALVAEAAAAAGRDPAEVPLTMYVRVCVDDDVDAARRALGDQVLGYALARPGVDTRLGYRGHFGRMGFEEVLVDLEARRDAGAPMGELIDAAPDELLTTVGYFGPADAAPAAYRRLSEGLDETVVRIVSARPGLGPVVDAMAALTPERIAAAG
jgi:alkanesulfonate monooxygenase SsuD/methylene tetrahydromethanopterin reductase-like flavin-dependent oxidoreductase (luciferase family)